MKEKWIKVYQISIPIILLLLSGSVGYNQYTKTGVLQHDHPVSEAIIQRIIAIDAELREINRLQNTWHGQ